MVLTIYLYIDRSGETNGIDEADRCNGAVWTGR